MDAQRFRQALARRLSDPLVPLLVKSRINPTALSLLGFSLTLGVAFALARGHFLLGGLLLLFSGAFDLLDGALARALKRTSAFGALLDSTLDRLGEAALFFGLLIFFAGSLRETLLIFAALVGSGLVSYVRARAEGLGLKCEVGFFTRPERLLLLALGLLSGQVPIALWVLAVGTLLTAAQRFFYVWRGAVRKPPP